MGFTITPDELKKSAIQYRKELLVMMSIGLANSLQHMTLRRGVQYKQTVGQYNPNAQFGPYDPTRKNTTLNIAGRELEVFLGSVIKEFDPNEVVQSIYGSSTLQGEGLKNTPIAKAVLAAEMKSLSAKLNQSIFKAVRNASGTTSMDLYNGFNTIADAEITLGNLATSKKHLKAGQPTYFESKIRLTIDPTIHAIVEPDGEVTTEKKLTTIRSNYELWKKRIDEVNQGIAILSVRYWSGLPYKSTQVEICQFKKGAGIGIEKIYFKNVDYLQVLSDEKPATHSCIIKDIPSIAKYDGLDFVDFHNWFCAYDKTKPMAMIHFTTHRYNIHNLKTICIK